MGMPYFYAMYKDRRYKDGLGYYDIYIGVCPGSTMEFLKEEDIKTIDHWTAEAHRMNADRMDYINFMMREEGLND